MNKETNNETTAKSPIQKLSHPRIRVRKPSTAARLLQKVSNAWNSIEVFFIRHVYENLLIKNAKERFYLVFGGHIFFETLYSAVKFNLFDLLDAKPGLTGEEIAQALGVAEQPARILLLGLTSTDFLIKRGDRYWNTRLSAELLTSKSPKNVIPYVLLEHHGMYKAMPHFYESIRANKNIGLKEFKGDEPTFYERLAHDSELEKIFQDAMQALSVQTNQLLARFVDLSTVSYLVDVGGGDGTNVITLAKRFPHIRAAVFDLPSVCEIAKENIARHGLSDRIDVIPGNCFNDPLPQGADCFLFSHFFTIWSKQKDQYLLKKAHDALAPGGKVMIFNMMQNDDRTGPLSAAVGSPYFLTLATGEGMLYTWNEYETWMKTEGFTSVSRTILPRDHGIIQGVKE
jgi:SAM-dependent methyltransferase